MVGVILIWEDFLGGGSVPPMEGPEADTEVAEVEEDVVVVFFGIRYPAAKLLVVAVELEDAEAEPARIARSRCRVSSVSVTPISTVKVSTILGGGSSSIPLGTAAPRAPRTK